MSENSHKTLDPIAFSDDDAGRLRKSILLIILQKAEKEKRRIEASAREIYEEVTKRYEIDWETFEEFLKILEARQYVNRVQRKHETEPIVEEYCRIRFRALLEYGIFEQAKEHMEHDIIVGWFLESAVQGGITIPNTYRGNVSDAINILSRDETFDRIREHLRKRYLTDKMFSDWLVAHPKWMLTLAVLTMAFSGKKIGKRVAQEIRESGIRINHAKELSKIINKVILGKDIQIVVPIVSDIIKESLKKIIDGVLKELEQTEEEGIEADESKS